MNRRNPYSRMNSTNLGIPAIVLFKLALEHFTLLGGFIPQKITIQPLDVIFWSFFNKANTCSSKRSPPRVSACLEVSNVFIGIRALCLQGYWRHTNSAAENSLSTNILHMITMQYSMHVHCCNNRWITQKDLCLSCKEPKKATKMDPTCSFASHEIINPLCMACINRWRNHKSHASGSATISFLEYLTWNWVCVIWMCSCLSFSTRIPSNWRSLQLPSIFSETAQLNVNCPCTTQSVLVWDYFGACIMHVNAHCKPVHLDVCSSLVATLSQFSYPALRQASACRFLTSLDIDNLALIWRIVWNEKDQTRTLKHVGDVVYAPLLHLESVRNCVKVEDAILGLGHRAHKLLRQQRQAWVVPWGWIRRGTLWRGRGTSWSRRRVLVTRAPISTSHPIVPWSSPGTAHEVRWLKETNTTPRPLHKSYLTIFFIHKQNKHGNSWTTSTVSNNHAQNVLVPPVVSW